MREAIWWIARRNGKTIVIAQLFYRSHQRS